MVTQLVQCKICRRILEEDNFTDDLLEHILKHEINNLPGIDDVIDYFNIYGGEGSDAKDETADLERHRLPTRSSFHLPRST